MADRSVIRAGVKVTADVIKKGFKRAFAEPWPGRLRYEHFAKGSARKVAKGAYYEGLAQLRDAGEELNVKAERAVDVGDDDTANKAGAQAIGIEAWLWKKDVKSFQNIVDRIRERGTPSVQ